MKLCRFRQRDAAARVGLTNGEIINDLSAAGVRHLSSLLEEDDPVSAVLALNPDNQPFVRLGEVQLLPPVEQQEVWAAGVTYLRSKAARMEESDFSATAYDRVYAAERPEIFFKSLPHKVVGPGESVGIRHDARWNVPEPELSLVVNSKGQVAGYTIGNDMSSRDIEGENLLYLPQAKMYDRSCAVGPWIVIGATEDEARQWTIQLGIHRNGERIFSGESSVANIKRTFSELASFLCRCQQFPHGAVLLTGTGIVPDDSFTLAKGDVVSIEISGIGVLQNDVIIV